MVCWILSLVIKRFCAFRGGFRRWLIVRWHVDRQRPVASRCQGYYASFRYRPSSGHFQYLAQESKQLFCKFHCTVSPRKRVSTCRISLPLLTIFRMEGSPGTTVPYCHSYSNRNEVASEGGITCSMPGIAKTRHYSSPMPYA